MQQGCAARITGWASKLHPSSPCWPAHRHTVHTASMAWAPPTRDAPSWPPPSQIPRCIHPALSLSACAVIH